MKNNHISYNSKTNSVFAKSNNSSLSIKGNNSNNNGSNNGSGSGSGSSINKSESSVDYESKLKTKPMRDANQFNNSKSKNY